VALLAAGIAGHGLTSGLYFTAAASYLFVAPTLFNQNRKLLRNFARQFGPGSDAVERGNPAPTGGPV